MCTPTTPTLIDLIRQRDAAARLRDKSTTDNERQRWDQTARLREAQIEDAYEEMEL